MMRVFNQDKTIELTTYDLEKGYLQNEKLFIAHHPAVEKVEGKFHYETIAVYPNGGEDVEEVWDIEPIEAREAYDEYEDIKVYIPYTEEELSKIKESNYKAIIESRVREKYSFSDELAILRQRDTKPEEFTQYFNYVEECKAKAKAEIYK